MCEKNLHPKQKNFTCLMMISHACEPLLQCTCEIFHIYFTWLLLFTHFSHALHMFFTHIPLVVHLIESSQRGVLSPHLLNTASMSPIQPAAHSTPPANSSAPERVSLQMHAGSLGGAVEVSPVSFTPEAVAASRDRRMFTPANFRFHPYY